jgi:hypothetical protein
MLGLQEMPYGVWLVLKACRQEMEESSVESRRLKKRRKELQDMSRKLRAEGDNLMDESGRIHGESEMAKQAGRLDAGKWRAEVSNRSEKDGAVHLMEADRLREGDMEREEELKMKRTKSAGESASQSHQMHITRISGRRER